MILEIVCFFVFWHLCTNIHSVDLWNFGLIVCEMIVGPDDFSEMESAGKYNWDRCKVDKECRTLLSILLEEDASKRKWKYIKQNGWLK